MNDEQPETSELREAQSRREAEEQALARSAAEEQETATHQRRADKAHYLREKLEERAESERKASGAAGAAGEDTPGSEGADEVASGAGADE